MRGEVVERLALERVTNIIVEETDSVADSCSLRLSAERRFAACPVARIGRGIHSPALAVHNDLLIDIIKRFSNGIHSVGVMKTHKVESKSVNMILVRPICYGIYHKLFEHLTLGSCIIAAARTV